MPVARRNITRIVAGMAGIIVGLLALAFPAVYLAVGWKSESEHLRTEAAIYAHQVTDLINRNPNMWKYEQTRLRGILSARIGKEGAEIRRVLDLDGNAVARGGEDPGRPVMTRTQPLMDSGEIVGSLVIMRSTRPLIVNTGLLAVIGGVLGVALFFLLRVFPLSALRNVLDQLSREKERAHVTLDSIGDGVITVDPQNRVVLVNRVAEMLTGWAQPEAAGKPVDEVFRLDGNVLMARDGSRRLVEFGGSPIIDGNGLSLGSVLVFRDVTEKARIEEELLKSQKLESLGILAGGIAHEIRNPLSGINIYIASIEQVCDQSEGFEPDRKEKIRIIVEQMKAAAMKMASIVQRVMDFSKPSPPRLEMVNLNAVAEEALRLSSSTLRKRGISISMDLAPELPRCRADARLIEQVLVNLITNAYQAMERIEGSKYLEIASSLEERWILIRVSDSGPGVPPSLRARIFDPFFTTRKEGSGIGLSFAHRIVTDHGGTLGVATSRWGGAEFRIGLPRTGPETTT